jgi:NhaP-type Na+/H+ or K+/H+ antiporter
VSRGDRAIGIALGLVIGIVAVILFVFLGSEDTIDAPAVDRSSQPVERPAGGPGP